MRDVSVQQSSRRCVPVRLCDLPQEVRMSGARKACRYESDPEVRLEILVAAVFPSERVYFVAATRERAA